METKEEQKEIDTELLPLSDAKKKEIADEVISKIAREQMGHELGISYADKSYEGVLIVFEGADGSGKTTMAKKVVGTLNDTGLVASYVRTPGGTTLGEKLRNIVLHEGIEVSEIPEAYLFLAQLAQCVEHVIKPRLMRGEIVVCDRLFLSSLAYQGAGRGLDLNWLYTEQIRCLQGVWPEIGFLMSTEQVHKKDTTDKMEMAGEEFTLRVKAYYDNILSIKPSLCTWIQPILMQETQEETHEVIFERMVPYMNKFFATKGMPKYDKDEETSSNDE